MYFRSVVPGGAGGAMASPDFGRSVNPISTSAGGRLCPPNYYWYPRIFRYSDGPDIYDRVSQMAVQIFWHVQIMLQPFLKTWINVSHSN